VGLVPATTQRSAAPLLALFSSFFSPVAHTCISFLQCSMLSTHSTYFRACSMFSPASFC